MMWYHGGFGWWLLMSVGMVVCLALVIWVGVVLARGTTIFGSERAALLTPQEILAKRFAQGEINKEDFERDLDALRSANH